MKNRKKLTYILIQYFAGFFSVIFLFFLVASSNSKDIFVVSNINTVKSVESSKIKQIIDIIPTTKKETLQVQSVTELKNHHGENISFTGTLTGYGPDCVGCGGILGCPPHQNVKNGNIYYQDKTYGKIRILAADPSIPCGSIVKISNYTNIEGEFYGIVLDRGSAIKGLTMDLLYDSEKTSADLGRKYNILFKIERWGF